MVNYKLKSELLNNGVFELYKTVSKSVYKLTGQKLDSYLDRNGFYNLLMNSDFSDKVKFIYSRAALLNNYEEILKDNIKILPLEKCTEIILEFQSTDELREQWKECSRISQSHCQRVSRLKKYISKMLSKPCLFLTLTFSPFALGHFSEGTRRKYVQEFLTSLKCPYVANIDYGKKNEREHYHALVQTDRIDYSAYRDIFDSTIKGKRVRTSDEDITRTARYIAKLTNHAIKDTTKGCRLIYSRKYKP